MHIASRDVSFAVVGAAIGAIGTAVAALLLPRQRPRGRHSIPAASSEASDPQKAVNGHVAGHAAPAGDGGSSSSSGNRTLVLQRPLISFDLETTGLNTGKDRIVEIAAVKLMPDGQIIVKGPQILNPKMKIPPHVTQLHGITDEDVAQAPTFSDVAAEWREFLEGCDLHGYNAKKFDVPLLRSEFRRVGMHNVPALGTPVLDSFRIFCHYEPRTLSAALRFFCDKQLEGAHGALADALAAQDVLLAQVARYPSLPATTSQLAVWCSQPRKEGDATWDGRLRWEGNDLVFAYGKHQDIPLRAVLAENKNYLMWMKGQDFSDEVLILVELAMLDKLPSGPEEWDAMLADGSWAPIIAPPVYHHDWGT